MGQSHSATMVYATPATQMFGMSSIPGFSGIEKSIKSKYGAQIKSVGCSVIKLVRPAADRMIRSALAGATGGISTAVNTVTRGITGVASMFGIGKGPTDFVQWGEDQVIHYIGC